MNFRSGLNSLGSSFGSSLWGAFMQENFEGCEKRLQGGHQHRSGCLWVQQLLDPVRMLLSPI